MLTREKLNKFEPGTILLQDWISMEKMELIYGIQGNCSAGLLLEVE